MIDRPPHLLLDVCRVQRTRAVAGVTPKRISGTYSHVAVPTIVLTVFQAVGISVFRRTQRNELPDRDQHEFQLHGLIDVSVRGIFRKDADHSHTLTMNPIKGTCTGGHRLTAPTTPDTNA